MNSWSLKFQQCSSDLLSVDLGIAARELDLGLREPARDADVALTVAGTDLKLLLRQAELAGGTLSGEATLAVGDGMVAANIRGVVGSAALDRLVWADENGPVASGTLDASFDLSGSGHSLSGIVSTTAGSGSFSLTDGALDRLDPAAFAEVARAVDADIAFDDAAIATTFGGALAGGMLPVDTAAGSFTVENGVVTFSTVSVDSPAADIRATATADLNTLRLSSNWTLKPRGGVSDTEFAPQAGFSFRGPIAAPERAIELGPLMAFLRNRVLEKQLAEIEKLQAEVREREERTRQLREEREAAEKEAAEKTAAEKAAAQKAAAARRKAEAERAAETPPPEAAPLNILPEFQPPLDLTPPQGIGDIIEQSARPAPPPL